MEKKRGIFTLRDLQSSDYYEQSGSEYTSSSDNEICFSEEYIGNLNEDDMQDMGIADVSNLTQKKQFMVSRINESLIPNSVREAAREAYLASYERWKAGQVEAPCNLQSAIAIGQQAIDVVIGVSSSLDVSKSNKKRNK